MTKKKINPQEIDEDFIMASIKGGSDIKSTIVKENARATESNKVTENKDINLESPNRFTTKWEQYESKFIKNSKVTARLGKTVYIRKEFHDRIVKIIQVIGGNEVSLFSYIDNVLMDHFTTHQSEITEAYENRDRKLF